MNKSTSIAVAVALSTFAMVIAPEKAEATGVVAGATEPTQIMNNVELVMSYAKQVEIASTQLLQYNAQLQALKNLDTSTLSGILKGVNGISNLAELTSQISTVGELSETLQSVSTGLDTLYKEGTIANDVITKINKAGISYTAGNYVSMLKALSSLHIADYQKRLTAIQSSVTNVNSDITRLNAMSSAASDITSQVGGLQAVVQSNAEIGKMLGGLQSTLSQSAEMDVEQAKYLMTLSQKAGVDDNVRANMSKDLFQGDADDYEAN